MDAPAIKKPKELWWPTDYSPGFSVEDWLELLHDKNIFTADSLKIMKRMKDYGGSATCKQLAVKYGGTPQLYNTRSSVLGKRIAQKTGCPVMKHDTRDSRWWPILYFGRYVDNKEEGVYAWKLRDELAQALEQMDLSQVPLYEPEKLPAPPNRTENKEPRLPSYWWLNASPKIWSFSSLAVGDVVSYTLRNENGNKRRVFQNFLDAQVGDVIIGYESNPVKQIVAIGKLSAEQDGEKIEFEKTEGLASPIDYKRLKESPELEQMEFFTKLNGSLFKLTQEEYDSLLDIIREENPRINREESLLRYTKDDFLGEVYMAEQRYDRLASVLKNKKNIILQGAPGVGKTFAAKRLAYSIMGQKDESRIEFIQFHQNYSYEDFIMGYKPADNGFELKHGVFYRFCKKASNHPDKEFFFIIDEINRGNMSKIFGELLMLIEKDYRGTTATLAYNGLRFFVPANLHLIGMMNTADRSLAMIDYALRRRFSFFDMDPGFDSRGFKEYQKKLKNDTFDLLIQTVKALNEDIAQDRSLGKGFLIGHSYFCGIEKCTPLWIMEVVEHDILPMLKEYWFDETDKFQHWERLLSGLFTK